MRPILVRIVIVRVREPARALRALHAVASECELVLDSPVGMCRSFDGIVEGWIVRKALWEGNALIRLSGLLLALPLRAVLLGDVRGVIVHDRLLIDF